MTTYNFKTVSNYQNFYGKKITVNNIKFTITKSNIDNAIFLISIEKGVFLFFDNNTKIIKVKRIYKTEFNDNSLFSLKNINDIYILSPYLLKDYYIIKNGIYYAVDDTEPPYLFTLINNDTMIDKEDKDYDGKISELKEQIRYINVWQQNYYKDIPDEFPLILENDEEKLLCKYLNKSKNYLEFGSGGSTFLALKSNVNTIYSIESNKKWIDYLKSYNIVRNNIENRLYFFHIDIGDIRDDTFGWPINNDFKSNYPNYSNFNWLDDKQINSIDTIFIDGRFRVACALMSYIKSKNDIIVLMHDYGYREQYHVIENFYNIIEHKNNLYVFKKKDIENNNYAIKLYQEYKYIII